MKNANAMFILTNTLAPLAMTTALRVIDPPIPVGLYVGVASVFAITVANYYFLTMLKEWLMAVWLLMISTPLVFLFFGELSIFSGAPTIYFFMQFFPEHPC